MLGKLFKYDFKALNRTMLPLQGGVLLAGVVGSLLVRLGFSSINTSVNTALSPYASAAFPIESLLLLVSTLLSFVFYTAIIASYWVTLFLVARHFYQSMLKDEGYLSMTLPVTVGQSLLSKTFAGSLWLLINQAILIISFFLFIVVGFASVGPISPPVVETFQEIGGEISNVPGVILMIELIALSLLTVVHAVTQINTSLTIGASLAQTHKVLAAIGIFVAINMGMQTIMSILMFIVGTAVDNSNLVYSQYDWFYIMQAFILPPLIIFAALAVIYFFVSRHLLQTKLNLE